MAFARPTFSELVTRISADMRSRLLEQGRRADPLLRRAKMWVLARVYAAIWHTLYETLEWLSKQILPSTATDIDYLKAFGTAVAVDQKLAAKSVGVVRFTGTNTTVVPSGTQFVRDDGAVYVTTESGTISGGQVDVAAEADLAGADYNLESGVGLSLVDTIIGVDSDVSFVSGWDTGTDDETLEPLRDRILQRTRARRGAGTKDDYETWALQVDGVFRALCVPLARGAGTVDVYFLHNEGTGAAKIPTSGQIAAVQAHIDTLRPPTADVIVKAPTEVDVDVEIADLTPDNSGTRDAIEAELESMFLASALLDTTTTIYPSAFNIAIARADDVEGFDLNDPSAAVTASIGEVLVLGSVSYT